MKNRSYLHRSSGIASAALLALIALGGLLFAVMQDKMGEGSAPRAVLGRIYAQRASGWEVKIEAPQQLIIGKEDAHITLHTSRPGSFYLIQAGTDGKSLELIFPNALDSNNLVPAGDTNLPRATWRLAAGGPAGTGELLAVVTPTPVSESAIRAALAQQRPPDMGAEYGAARASWTERNP
jgi:hypothetical protein